MNTKVVKNNPDAIIPTKAHTTDVGYDLTAISIYKKISDNTILFDTGIAVTPPTGYYIEIVPRSSINKFGYMLSNSVGIIDPDYTGNLLISLTKVDQKMPNLEPPFKICQLIIRKLEPNINFIEYDSLNQTVRGDGGFGSSDCIEK